MGISSFPLLHMTALTVPPSLRAQPLLFQPERANCKQIGLVRPTYASHSGSVAISECAHVIESASSKPSSLRPKRTRKQLCASLLLGATFFPFFFSSHATTREVF